jgi:hypothetical protein
VRRAAASIAGSLAPAMEVRRGAERLRLTLTIADPL